MHRNFGNCWVEYRDPIDLNDCPSTTEIDSCWYQKGTNNKWTSDSSRNWIRYSDLQLYSTKKVYSREFTAT